MGIWWVPCIRLALHLTRSYRTGSIETFSVSISDYDEFDNDNINGELNNDNSDGSGNDARSNVSYGETCERGTTFLLRVSHLTMNRAFRMISRQPSDFDFGGNLSVSETLAGTPERARCQAAAVQAPFRRGAEIAVDTTVRDKFETNPNRFSFKNLA